MYINTLIIEMINICGTALSALIMRWLLGLSTIEKDIQWIKSTTMWKSMQRLHFFRGLEYWHQVKGAKIVNSVAER